MKPTETQKNFEELGKGRSIFMKLWKTVYIFQVQSHIFQFPRSEWELRTFFPWVKREDSSLRSLRDPHSAGGDEATAPPFSAAESPSTVPLPQSTAADAAPLPTLPSPLTDQPSAPFEPRTEAEQQFHQFSERIKAPSSELLGLVKTKWNSVMHNAAYSDKS